MFLFILNGAEEGKRIDLSPGTYRIGRADETDITVESDKYVSGLHAELQFDENEKLTLVDKKSKNGTFLLGEQVKRRTEVKPGDIFRIGHTFIKYSRRSQDRYFPELCSGERSPEATVVVDIVGSSKIAQVMGDNVASKVKSLLNLFMTKNLKKYPAEYFKSTGDGYMIIFSKVVPAVMFSINLLKAIRGGGTFQGFHIRIGINFGETNKLEDGDRGGTSVDMAFRLESVKPQDMHQTVVGIKKDELPRVDRIFVSEVAHNFIATKSSIRTRCIGFFDLKGFPGRHRIFEILI